MLRRLGNNPVSTVITIYIYVCHIAAGSGIDILSYCGFIEKAVQKGVDTLSAKAIAVEAPKVAAKVEAALNTAIGGQVRIPLKL